MENLPIAIILGFDINGLGAVRSLAKKSIQTVVICPGINDPSYHSKHPVKKILFEYQGNYDSDLLELLLNIDYSEKVLIPTSDETVEFIDRNRSSLLQHYRLSVPDSAAISCLIDKKTEVKVIAETGVPCPYTVLNIADVLAGNISLTEYPLLIKPRTYKDCSIIKKKNIVLNNSQELNKFLTKYSKSLDRFIIQKIITGEDSNQWVCNCVFDSESSLISAFMFRRLHLSPAHYGVTSMARSEANKTVLEHVKKIGKSLNYTGPAMVEFKYDQNDDQYKYIELNPRLGMCNHFDTSCGVNSAYFSYCLAIGYLPKHVNPAQKESIYFLSLFDDFYSRYKDNKSIFQILKTYIKLIPKNKSWAYYDITDIKPFLKNLAMVLFPRKIK